MLWFVLGLALGIGFTLLAVSARSGRIRVRWYQWLLGIAAVPFYLLAVQNYLALTSELEPALATFSLMAFGLPGVLLTALIWIVPLLGRRGGAASRRQAEVETA
jgi:hypothetical protein